MSIKATRAFQRQVYILAISLGGLCLVLVLLTWLQGPRVRSATIDINKVTLQGDQRLLLQLNQSPGTVGAKDISITPSAPLSATSGGKTIALQFAQPLRNDTTYRLRIAASGGSIDYSFTTGTASFFYLVDLSGGSELHKRWIGSDKDVVVLDGELIEDYIVLGDTVVYTTRDAAGKTSLRLFDSLTREHNELPLPEDGMIEDLRAAPDGRSFGFLFLASDYRSENSHTIVRYNLSKNVSEQVLGLDDKPFKAIDWQFARNGKAIIALGTDHTLFLLNPGSTPTPFGQYDDVEGFTYDDSGILVTKWTTGKEIINLKSGQRTPVPQLDNDSYISIVTPLNTEPGLLFRGQSYREAEATNKITVRRNEASKQVYSAESVKGYIAFNTLSPNDQYVAVELRNADTETNTIEIVDTWSNKVTARLTGNKVRWATGL